MAIKVHIPTPMRQHTAGNAVVEVPGGTVQAALDALGQQFPDIRQRMFDGAQLKRFLNVYLNDEDIRYLAELQTPAGERDTIVILPAMAGGAA
jgi:molybdopterin converting factor small subunit